MDEAYDYSYELGVLRRTWPGGLPERDYGLLLAALHKQMSFRAIGALVGEFTGRHPVDVYFDANGAASVIDPGGRLSFRDVDRVWVRLLDNGWMPEFRLPRHQEPGFADEAIAALRRAYPDGLSDDQYLPLLAALARDIDDLEVIAYIVSEAFPARHPSPAWSDAQKLQSGSGGQAVLPSALEQVWQHLLSCGLPPSGGPRWPGA
jgi:hypothetical protein